MVYGQDGKLYGLFGLLLDRDEGSVSSLFSLNPLSAVFTILKTFQNRDYVNAGITWANDGKIYGMTSGLGELQYGRGTIYSYDPSSSEYKVEFDFNDVSISNPHGALAKGSDGTLYGVASRGGARDQGGIFSFNILSSSFSEEWQISVNESGSHPSGTLAISQDGKLYGMTTFGGNNGYGTIFSYHLVTSSFTKLKDFDYDDGAHPQGGLLLAGTEILYGMTRRGGSSGQGVLFSFDLPTLTYTKLKDFTGPDGANPVGSLIQASDGKLYGLTSFGGPGNYGGNGVIFSYDPKEQVFRNLHDFINGSTPNGSLLEGSDGRLYGSTSRGGSDFNGTLFCFDPKTLSYNLIYNFYNNGSEPNGSLIQANYGKLYGMATRHGKFNGGVIFSVTPSQNDSYRVLHDFNLIDGGTPYGNLMVASNGKLYGLTFEGGTSGLGVIFSYDVSSGRYSKLIDLDGKTGSFPNFGSGLVEAGSDSVNASPILSSLGNQTVKELQQLKFVAKASDSDDPADTLDFGLGNPASGIFPEGATINKKSGLFSWTPTEVHGPGNYRVKVIVSDGHTTDEEEIGIGVLETVTHPVMTSIGAKSVNEDTMLSFTATATDADLPAAPLRYSLVKVKGTNFPDGATIDPESGTFVWTPEQFQGPGEYCLIVRVSDGECTDEERIVITVNEVNSPPSFTKGPDVSLFDDSRRQVINGWAKNISSGATDEEDQSLNFLVANNNQQLFAEQPAVTPEGTLTFATVSNMYGTATVTVILNDNGGTDFGGSNKSQAQTFLITVNTADINLFAYPNPFGKNAMVGFTLPAHEDFVTLDLNDLKGARIQRIYEGKGEANQTHSFTFDGSNYSPGIYFLRLVTSNQKKTFKIIMAE